MGGGDRHFAVFAPPLRGHYDPLSALAAELLDRGHRITFIHHPDARNLVQAKGAGFVAIGESEAPIDDWTRPMARIKGLIGLKPVMERMDRFTTMFCREAPGVLERLGVDAIIADQLEPAGGLVAEHLGIPWVSVADTLPMNREAGIPPPFINWSYDPSPRGTRRNAGGWAVSDLLLRSFNRSIARNARILGLTDRSRIEDCFSPLLQLAQIVPGLDFPRQELPPSFHYTGPLRRGSEEAFELPPDERPTVYASLGTLQGSRVGIFRKIARACDALGLRLILTQGGHGRFSEAEHLPGNPLVYDWLPQRAVLSQVDLVVCHAGMNSVLDPLAAGLPMVVMPLAFEQPAIAARVELSGAGLMLSRRCSPTSLKQAIGKIRDEPAFRARAEALRDEIKAAGGVSRAADLIELKLGASAPPANATMAHAARDDARDDNRSGSK